MTTSPDRRAYTRGLHEVGRGAWAWLQPTGAWGLNNAGLVVDGEESLLVDTLFDLAHTRAMLSAMADAAPAARAVDTVVNTHANGDHCWGNQLVKDAEIIAARRSAEEMAELPPARVALLLKAARFLRSPPGRLLGGTLAALGLSKVRNLVDAAPFVLDIFGQFSFDGIELTPPTRTFERELSLKVGDRDVHLYDVGPAHTRGDVVAWVPDEKVVYTGDILFIDAHPIVWEGPVSNWIRACDRILELEADVIVPGHGPLTDAAGVRRVREYLAYLTDEATRRYHAGMSADDAARDIAFEDFRSWTEAERVVINVATLYRELAGEAPKRGDPVEPFARMARLAKHQQGHGHAH